MSDLNNSYQVKHRAVASRLSDVESKGQESSSKSLKENGAGECKHEYQ